MGNRSELVSKVTCARKAAKISEDAGKAIPEDFIEAQLESLAREYSTKYGITPRQAMGLLTKNPQTVVDMLMTA